jgi:two-component system nitrate/nitrite response regulator NarL
MKILIVDDHVLFREGLVSLLEKQSDLIVVGEAGTIHEAIERSNELQPDLVLLDTDLPDGNGVEAINGILANRPDTIIVVLAQYDSEDSFITAIRNGAKGYLPKKIPLAKLVLSLQAVKRGEAVMSRAMISRLVVEFQKLANNYTNGIIDFDSLTSREMEVLQLLSENATNQEIAGYLTISENTVKAHIHNILEKLNLPNRHQVGKLARRHGITSK